MSDSFLNKQVFIKFVLYIFLLTSIALHFMSSNTPSHGIFTITLLIIDFFSIVLLFWFKYLSRDAGFISLTSIFILGYIIVFVPLSLLRVSGISVLDQFETFFFYNPANIDITLSLSTMGLVAFIIGVMKRYQVMERPGKHSSMRYKNNRSILPVVILAYISLGAFLIMTPTYASGLYGIEISSLSQYFSTLFKVSFWSAMILKIYSYSYSDMKDVSLTKYLLSYGFLFLFLILTYTLLSFYVGDRGPIISISIAVFGFFFARKKTIGFVKFMVILIISSNVMTMIAEVRTRYYGESYLERMSSYEKGSGSVYFGQETLLDSFLELSASERTLNHVVLRLQEGEFDYHYGTNQILYITSIIPGLSGVYFRLFLDNAEERNGSAMFASYLIQDGDIKYGDGTSIITDLYLDFGWPGVVFFLFIFGRVVARYESALFKPVKINIFPFIFIMIYFSQSLYLARSALLLDLGTVVLIFVVIRINHFILFREKIQ